MTEQIDFSDFLVRAPEASVTPGIFGTAVLSGVSGFATSLESISPVIARRTWQNDAASTRRRSTILKRFCRDIPV
jgi:hypothetical protein